MEAIEKISITDKRYPKILKGIKDAPKMLFIRGKILTNENCFAIVGTRRWTAYGKQIALDIAENLADEGLTIVSGLAPGIDTFSHQAVVENKKRTIAVLGTGIDDKTIYPRSNVRLAKKILENSGCLISEYPPRARGTKFTFPQRNRIISGLSLGTLVIEAKIKSGSLITANYAFEQKRKVFAVPGSIFSSNSKGCHYLIKKGAILTESSADILNELNLPKTLKSHAISGETPEENSIIESLKEGSLFIDKIIEKTKLPASKVSGTLIVLEIKNKVRNLGGNKYAISNR